MRLYKRVPDTDERGHTVVYELATPSEIAAAHPKCGSCRHFMSWNERTEGGECTNEDIGRAILDRTESYCEDHTELTGAPDETE